MSQNCESGVDRVKKVIAALLLTVFLTGCQQQNHTDVTSRIVTEIVITCQTCNDFTRRYYNTHQKMQQILLYLRAVKPGFTPDEDPESLAGRTICITLHLADGSTKLYRQKKDRYLQEDHHPWKKIKPDWGATLYQIILENSSDPETDRMYHDPLPGGWRYRQHIAEACKP